MTIQLKTFKHPAMKGSWQYSETVKAYLNPNNFNIYNVIDNKYNGLSGVMAWGKQSHNYGTWAFFVAEYDWYPIISRLWVYSANSSNVVGEYTITHYDSIFDLSNPYALDSGVISL